MLVLFHHNLNFQLTKIQYHLLLCLIEYIANQENMAHYHFYKKCLDFSNHHDKS